MEVVIYFDAPPKRRYLPRGGILTQAGNAQLAHAGIHHLPQKQHQTTGLTNRLRIRTRLLAHLQVTVR